jgi:hypothetical protein
MTHRPNRIGAVTVRLEASEIACVWGPGNRRWHMIAQQDMEILAPLRHPPRTGAAGLFVPGVHLTAAVGLGTRIHRVFEQGLQGPAVGPSPLQGAFGRALPHTYSHVDTLMDEIA